jgi:glucokinase
MGARGLAAELGHVTVMTDGPLCGCGQKGHLEALASGTAIAHWVEQRLFEGAKSSLSAYSNITALHISQAAGDGDRLAFEALTRAGTYLGIAIAGFLHIFNPTIVIIGGGVSRSGDTLLEPMRVAIREHIMTPQYLDDLIVTTAVLGDGAGLLGALALARSHEMVRS